MQYFLFTICSFPWFQQPYFLLLCLILSHFVLQPYFHFSSFFIATAEIPTKNKHECTLSLSLSFSVGTCGSTRIVHSVEICSHFAICLSSSELYPIFWAFPLRCLLCIWELSPAVCKMAMSHSNVIFLQSLTWDFDSYQINFSPFFSLPSQSLGPITPSWKYHVI